MSGLKGVKETKDGAAFFGALTTSIVRVAADGDFKWYEAIEFREPAALLPAAVNGYQEIDDELLDLDSQEGKEIAAAFAETAKLDPTNAEEEQLIESGVQLSLDLLAYFNDVRTYRARKKAESQA